MAPKFARATKRILEVGHIVTLAPVLGAILRPEKYS